MAQRANVSATWYTWLEQGREGGPSLDVLDQLPRALTLTAAERDHPTPWVANQSTHRALCF